MSWVSVARRGQAEAQGIGAIEVDDVDGVDAVALRLGHPLALAVEDHGVDVDVLEGHVAHVELAEDDHAGHPEGDDVAGGGEDAGRVELRQLGGFLGPAQGRVGPEGGGEPGVEDVGVLREAVVGLEAALEVVVALVDAGQDAELGGAELGVVLDLECDAGLGGQVVEDGAGDLVEEAARSWRTSWMAVSSTGGLFGLRRGPEAVAVGIVEREGSAPDRDAVAPPELAADAPVALLGEPVDVALGVAVGVDLEAPGGDGVDGLLGEAGGAVGVVAHADEPLVGEVGLDGGLGAVGVLEGDEVAVRAFEEALLFEVLRGRACGRRCGRGRRSLRAGVLVVGAVGVQEVDHGQVVAEAGLVVVGVVGGGDLDAAGAEGGVDEFAVGDDGDLAVGEREVDLLADQVLVAGVVGVDGHGGVAQHGLGAGGGDVEDVVASRRRGT